MSDQLQQELQQAKVVIAQVNARLAANEQLSTNLIKDLLDTKTNLNLYMAAHGEVSKELQELKSTNELLKKEIEVLKNKPECADAA